MTELLASTDGTPTHYQTADPITTEVIRHSLNAAAEDMRLALCRTAFSQVLYEVQDFAAAIYDEKVQLLAQAQTLPLFLGTLGYCVETTVRKLEATGGYEPGDVVLTTYGYDIGAHPQDATIIVPAFYDSKLVGYVAIKAHHLDIGAKDLYCTDTVDNFQEGVIFPSVKLYRRGVLQRDLYDTLLANSRMPKNVAGDLAAQIAAATHGLAGLTRILERYGKETFDIAVDRMFDHGEKSMRAFLGSLPDGRYSGAGMLDSNGVTEDAIPFEIAVEVHGSEITVDFSNAPDEQVGPTNCPFPATNSATRTALMTFAARNEYANEGHFRPLKVVTRPGTIFHPNPPAPIFMYSWVALQAVDVIHRALGECLPEGAAAGNGGDLGSIIWWGKDERGAFWGDAMDHVMGQGASRGRDGGAPLMHISCSGIRSTPTEVWEARRPFLIERGEYAADSGGAGEYRGGLGVEFHYRALQDAYFTLACDRTKSPPWGLASGRAAEPNRYRLRRSDGSLTEIRKSTRVLLAAGDVLEVRSGGGGGFGSPGDREPSAVRADIEDGYLSNEAAEREYPHVFQTGAADTAEAWQE